MTTLRTKIEELCAASPKTSKELAALLDEDPTMVTQACYRLRNRGRLTGTKRGKEIVNSLPSVDERLGFLIAVLSLERMADYLMAQQGGSEWEIGRALDQFMTLFPDQPELHQALKDYAAGLGSLASAQAAQSTLFLFTKIEEVLAKMEHMHNDINNLKTVNNDVLERLNEQDATMQALRQEVGELRIERREVGARLQRQITELKERFTTG